MRDKLLYVRTTETTAMFVLSVCGFIGLGHSSGSDLQPAAKIHHPVSQWMRRRKTRPTSSVIIHEHRVEVGLTSGCIHGRPASSSRTSGNSGVAIGCAEFARPTGPR